MSREIGFGKGWDSLLSSSTPIWLRIQDETLKQSKLSITQMILDFEPLQGYSQ